LWKNNCLSFNHYSGPIRRDISRSSNLDSYRPSQPPVNRDHNMSCDRYIPDANLRPTNSFKNENHKLDRYIPNTTNNPKFVQSAKADRYVPRNTDLDRYVSSEPQPQQQNPFLDRYIPNASVPQQLPQMRNPRSIDKFPREVPRDRNNKDMRGRETRNIRDLRDVPNVRDVRVRDIRDARDGREVRPPVRVVRENNRSNLKMNSSDRYIPGLTNNGRYDDRNRSNDMREWSSDRSRDGMKEREWQNMPHFGFSDANDERYFSRQPPGAFPYDSSLSERFLEDVRALVSMGHGNHQHSSLQNWHHH